MYEVRCNSFTIYDLRFGNFVYGNKRNEAAGEFLRFSTLSKCGCSVSRLIRETYAISQTVQMLHQIKKVQALHFTALCIIEELLQCGRQYTRARVAVFLLHGLLKSIELRSGAPKCNGS